MKSYGGRVCCAKTARKHFETNYLGMTRFSSGRRRGTQLAPFVSHKGRPVKILDRERDAISLTQTLDRTAFWLTIHGPTQAENRVVRLSVMEAKLLADALLFHAEEVEINAGEQPDQ